MLKDFLIRFWKEEDGFIGGLVSAGLGIASSIFGKKSSDEGQELAGQGYDYARNSPVVQRAQEAGVAAYDQPSAAMGLRGSLLGLNGQPAQTQGFDTFRDATGYDFRMSEGLSAIEGSRAARGILNSGATAKALNTYAQGMASDEFGRYMDYLGQQQATEVQQQQFNQQTGLNAALGVAGAGASAGAQQAAINRQGTEDTMSGIGGLARGVASIFGF